MAGSAVGAQQVHSRSTAGAQEEHSRCTGGTQQVQIRPGDSELLPVALSIVGAWLGSGLYVSIGAICLQSHLILSLY